MNINMCCLSPISKLITPQALTLRAKGSLFNWLLVQELGGKGRVVCSACRYTPGPELEHLKTASYVLNVVTGLAVTHSNIPPTV